jgi:hypothetical protein
VLLYDYVMENKENQLEIDLTDKYKHQIDIWHRTYNINRDKIVLFYDFLSSLYELVDSTFLGKDVLYNEIDQRNHFNWCWKKIVSDFEKEKIYFKEKGTHYEYFWNFFFEAFYIVKLDEKESKIFEYFYKLFDFAYKKSRSELDVLTEVYKLLDQNLKK